MYAAQSCLCLLCIFLLSSGDKQFFPNSLHGGNIRLPLVGLGTAGLQERTREAVLFSLSLGIRLIDSAQADEWYNEEGVGQAIAEFEDSLRDQGETVPRIAIVTKVHPRSYGYVEMNDKILQSKQAFKRDSLDAVLLHAPWCWPNSCTPQQEQIGWERGWDNLVKLKKIHNISAIGVSNFSPDLLRQLLSRVSDGALPASVEVVQNWMDPFHQDVEMRQLCDEFYIQYMAYSSFGTQWNRNPNPVLDNYFLQEIGRKHNVSVAQVVMQWLLQKGVVAIPRSSHYPHLEDNFALITRLLQSLHVSNVCMVDYSEGASDNNRCKSTGSEGTIANHAPEGHAEYDEPSQISETFLNALRALVVLDEFDMRGIEALDGTLGDPWD
jgi:diketogulonate reductase-like aldo/keto reductase